MIPDILNIISYYLDIDDFYRIRKIYNLNINFYLNVQQDEKKLIYYS